MQSGRPEQNVGGAGEGAENGAERARKSDERERGVKKIRWSGSGSVSGAGVGGRVSGAERRANVTEGCVSGERKFPPLPLRSHALDSPELCLYANTEVIAVTKG